MRCSRKAASRVPPKRLHLSPSAMSRALARLREATGDPLLVRAGRGLVPTPRALELRERVSQLVQDAEAVLRPAEKLDLKQLVRTFTLRTREGFVENFGADLIARVGQEAPGVRLCFVQKPNKESTSLRDGTVDLETGVVGKTTGPEVRAQALFQDRFIGVVRQGHALSQGRSRRPVMRMAGTSASRGRVLTRDRLMKPCSHFGLEREIVTIVGGFSTALALARDLRPDRHVCPKGKPEICGLECIVLPPILPPEITVSLLWHPRMDADPAHRWLRSLVLETARQPKPQPDCCSWRYA